MSSSYEPPTVEQHMDIERFFFTEPHHASFQEMLTRYNAMVRLFTEPHHASFQEMLTRYNAMVRLDSRAHRVSDANERAYTRAEITLSLMREFYPLETMVWEQEQEDERMSRESTDNVTSGEEF